MKKFINLKREIVWVEDFTRHNSFVIVHYKGEKYKCSLGVFGTKLFPMDITTKNYLKNTLNINVDILTNVNPNTKSGIKNGQTVKLKNCSTDEILTVKICGVHAEQTYKRMGGSYYGNSVEVKYVGNDFGLKNDVFNISAISPLGKSLLNKSCGDEIMVLLPGNKFEKYKIIRVCK